MPGTHHIPERHPKGFSGLIAHAQKCEPPTEIEHGEIVGGFAHHQVVELAPKIIDLIKRGRIRKFVVMAGCDGRMPSRDYYTRFAEALPGDCMINDSYSLVRIAMTLKDTLGVKSINDLFELFSLLEVLFYSQRIDKIVCFGS